MHRKKIDGVWTVIKKETDAMPQYYPIIPRYDEACKIMALQEFRVDPPMSYQQYLNSKHWAILKDYVLELPSNAKCIINNCTNKDRVLHHTRYDRLGTLNEVYDLICVCHKHHTRIHGTVMQRYKCHLEEWSLFKITKHFVYDKNNVEYNYYEEE